MSSAFSCRPVVGFIFDGDDTLWKTEQLYDMARTRARQIVKGAGLDGARWEEIERSTDIKNVRTFGFSTERFPTSCVQAYEQLCREVGCDAEARVAARVQRAAHTAFLRKAPLVTRARKTLERLRASGHKLALLTKGNAELQNKRIHASGLSDLFEVIAVVPEKNVEVIREVVARLKIRPEQACMVGNSLRSDILPAIEAGLQAVWIDAHVWEYERNSPSAAPAECAALSTLADIPKVVSTRVNG
ncbi:MAG: HAD hydrolase-like protein [Acidobacteriaceae bacterium]|nr:HAD hydrolase-like protein [Acidobacteriaceae bacterium]